MGLTKDDLAAIKNIVETAVEDSNQLIAAGFEEVHLKIDAVGRELGDKIDKVESIVTAEVKRVDKQSTIISNIRKQLRAV